MEYIQIIENAIEKLGEIKYVPNQIGYFVKMNDMDLGGQDYCRKCIPAAIKEQKKFYFEKRNGTLEKFKEVEETGFYKGINVKEKYSVEEIKKAKELELSEYSEEVKFTYEGHDPDFPGGCTEPIPCEGCGHYFYTDFVSDEESACYLLENFEHKKKLHPSLKWELSIAFQNYKYSEEKAQDILLKIAKNIIGVEINKVA